MLASLTSGMSPVTNLFDAMTQISMMSLFRLISFFVLNDWWNIIRNYTPPPTTTRTTSTTSLASDGAKASNAKGSTKKEGLNRKC